MLENKIRSLPLKNLHFDPENGKLKIGNEILERIGTDCTNNYFKYFQKLNYLE